MMHFYLFGPGGGWFNSLFFQKPDGYEVFVSKDSVAEFSFNRLLETIMRVWFSDRLNVVFNMPFKTFFIRRIIRKIIKESHGDPIIFLVTKGNKLGLNNEFIRIIKEEPVNITKVFWLQDILSATNNHVALQEFIENNYDYVITYDPEESRRYGYPFIENPYSRIKINYKSNDIKWDIIYVGNAKIEKDPHRYESIIAAYKYFCEHNLRVMFYINGVPKEKMIDSDSIVYNKWLDYSQIVNLVIQSNAILDIAQINESGTTLRMFEAITYNKKLVFNNVLLKDNPLYDNRFMLYYDEISDVDTNYLLDSCDVDYGSYEEIVPQHFFDNLVKIIKS